MGSGPSTMRAIGKSSIRRLKIKGLHRHHSVDITLNNSVSIFMGPNGIGKSTIINLFVYFLTKQWSRLGKIDFDSAEITFSSGATAEVTRAACVDFNIADLPTRYQEIVQYLIRIGEFDTVLQSGPQIEKRLSLMPGLSGMTVRDLRMAGNILSTTGQSKTSLRTLAAASKTIDDNFKKKILYFPTYRRIEQDINDLFMLSSSLRKRIQDEIEMDSKTSTAGHIEIARFGMEDIKSMLDSYGSNIKEFSRQQINSLSIQYLAGLGKNQGLDRYFFSSLTDERIRSVLGRVDDKELGVQERQDLTQLIQSIRDRTGTGRLNRAQENVAGYFKMIAEMHDRVSQREAALQSLATVLNRYIGPSKQAIYDPTAYKFSIRSGKTDIPLSGLSSGEKQIVSLFCTLALSPQIDHFVIIDEPELSLSVLWQELLLADIHEMTSCSELLVATHSPFIYGDSLARYTRDLSDSIEIGQSADE